MTVTISPYAGTWHINNMAFASVREVQHLHNVGLLLLTAVMQLKIRFSCDVTSRCQGILGVLVPEDNDTKIL
jgi:hypothetical protein